MQKNIKLKGCKCLGLVRCSRKIQRKKSLPQQREWLHSHAEFHEMTYVGDTEEAISASQIRKRPDLDKIFARKKTLNDFDKLLVQDLSRLTRGGVDHGLEIYFELKKVGVQIVSIVDGLIEGEDKIIEAARRFQEARASARANALATARGGQQTRASGRCAYTRLAPYGIDRLIVNAEGKPLYRLRNLPSGAQQLMDVSGTTVIKEYPRNLDGECCHHTRQQDEYVKLVKGEDVAVTTIRNLFRWFFVEKATIHQICYRLNDAHFPSPRGRLWTHTTIYRVLENPIYLGTGIGNREEWGIFWKWGKRFPEEISERKGNALMSFRPEEDWYRESHEDLFDLIDLDPAVRQFISEWQLKRHRHRAQRIPAKRGGDRHIQSSFFLKGILVAKQNQRPMTGRLSPSSSGGKSLRYYAVSSVYNAPRTAEGVLRRRINADHLEASIKDVVRQVLQSYQGTESAIRAALDRQATTKEEIGDDPMTLRKKRDALLREIDFWVKELSSLGEETIRGRIAPLKEAVLEVGMRLSEMERAKKDNWTHESATAAAKQLDMLLKVVADKWNSLCPLAMRQVLRILIGKMEVDLETYVVHFEIRVPSWVALDTANLEMCLEENGLTTTFFEAQSPWSISLAKIACKRVSRGREKCYECSRKPLTPLDLKKPSAPPDLRDAA